MAQKSYYVTVAPLTPKGKWLVCGRKLGKKEKLLPLYECRTELAADKAVDALNLLQDALLKLEVTAQNEVAELRVALSKARDEYNNLRGEANGLRHEAVRLKDELTGARSERDAAQIKALEGAK